jgi:2'-5' RNA ligase
VTYRSFIAVDFPNCIIEKIGLNQESLKEGFPSFVHWTRPENIHLTLKFLGEIDIEMVRRIEKSLDILANISKPFSLELDGIGVFPNWKNPRIIWIGFNKSEYLLSLVRQIETQMNNLGCQREEKPFSPHLTIGRVRDNAKPEDIRILENKCCSFARIAGSTQITEIHLYKSDLFHSGPVYTLLHSSIFKASQ